MVPFVAVREDEEEGEGGLDLRLSRAVSQHTRAGAMMAR
jgi:hypothetical protein